MTNLQMVQNAIYIWLDQAVGYRVYRFLEMLNVMKSRSTYADIFIWTGWKPNENNLRQAKEKKWGNVKSVCDQKRNSYGIYKNTLFSMCIHDTSQDVLVLSDKKYFLDETGYDSQNFWIL